MQDTVVFDLDGTLANIDHRLPLIQCDRPDWDRFFRECVKDVPVWPVIEVARAMLMAGRNVVVVSARSKIVEKESIDWIYKAVFNEWSPLSSKFGEFSVSLLREAGDTTDDRILKKAWLDSYGKHRILFVVDDRQKVVDMWRAEGLICLQCAAWPEWKRPKKQPREPVSSSADPLVNFLQDP